MKRTILLLFIGCIGLNVLAQSPRKLYKNSEKLIEQQNYPEAIKLLDQAISNKPEYIDAITLRALAQEKSNNLEKAVADHTLLIKLEPEITTHVYNSGRLYYKLQDYENANKYLSDLVIMDPRHFQGLQFKAFTHIKRKEFQQAIVAIDAAIEIEKTFLCTYTRGVAHDSLKNYTMAIENYNTTIGINPDYQKAFVALTKSYLSNNQPGKALENANRTVSKFPKYGDAYEARSLVYYSQKDLPNAINDLSKQLTIDSSNPDLLFKRGMYYFESKQFNNAKQDYSQVLAHQPNNFAPVFWRARACEELMEKEAAIKDFQLFTQHATQEKRIAEANNRIFELLRETDNPVIIIDTPMIVENKLAVLGDKGILLIKGKITDASKIEHFALNGETLPLDGNNAFEYKLNTNGVNSVELEATDVYKNSTKNLYELLSMETDAPLVRITTPYASDNNEIYLDSDDPNLFLEGVAQDENLIKNISIDGERAIYNDTELNPTFTASIDIQDKPTITIACEDAFGNKTETVFILNREGALIAEDNPMGKTWVIFIENSEYETFASLEGPTKDVSTMKSALATYQVHNFIHKKNMSKSEMERFFSIELRDQVKKNNVNSLLVWYAGHGKFINETGYWIPVDATRDDEFTYFNINALKAGMQSYSNYITHTLVVTDACESGPSFYQAMRATNEAPACDDVNATKFRSSQVFSSAGYELAADNSQFTKTFAKSLQYNENSCIPIESIVNQVTKAVSQNEDQKPKFGKIAGLEDENGTFFFMKK
jgi:tetratricopeptide (TPR) repeat protein